ncbi:MAG: ribose-5-phosphate isomerase RpiA [Treponema sp.]
MSDTEEQKRIVGEYAIKTLISEKKIVDGVKIGMGTGTTIEYVINVLSDFVNSGKVKDIAIVPTSSATLLKCEELGLPIFSLNSKRIKGQLDISIDGADRIDENKNLIKGGGAALLQEKIISYNSNEFFVVADESKEVKSLICDFPIPIEIIPTAYCPIVLALEKKGLKVKLREGKGKIGPVVTDSGHHILDVTYPSGMSINPKTEEIELNKIVGIVENGFFTNADKVFVAKKDGKVICY